MPKIIENVREMLLAEAEKQMIENGYSSVTVRSVAAACGLGVGTVYNYFKSKEMLIATFMLRDWQKSMELIYESCKKAAEPEVVLRSIYDELRSYLEKHKEMFADPQAIKGFSGVFTERHKQLRGQLAAPIYEVCIRRNFVNAGFLAEFIAESLLTWTVAGKSYEEIASVLLLLLKPVEVS